MRDWHRFLCLRFHQKPHGGEMQRPTVPSAATGGNEGIGLRLNGMLIVQVQRGEHQRRLNRVARTDPRENVPVLPLILVARPSRRLSRAGRRMPAG